MPNTKNIESLEKIKQSIENSQGFFVVDYRGLTVKEAQETRRALREAGAEMKVYKNNIVRIAIKELGLPDIGDDLVGTCAYVFYEKDAVEAAKCLKAEGDKLKKMPFVAGIADGVGLNADEARAYADLASRDELIAQFVYVISSPLRGIASVCAGPARGLVTALDAIAEQKKEQEAA